MKNREQNVKLVRGLGVGVGMGEAVSQNLIRPREKC